MADDQIPQILPTNNNSLALTGGPVDEDELQYWKKALQRMPSRAMTSVKKAETSGETNAEELARKKSFRNRQVTMVTKQLTSKHIKSSISCPIQLRFETIRFEVVLGKGKDAKIRRILKDISGIVQPGHITAIMGPSGCGKTTILNILATRNRHIQAGKVFANEKPIEIETYKSVMGYVPQDDLFLQNLTVREQITYSALLRLPTFMTEKEKLERVDQVIQELGLVACQNTKIGGDLVRGVSGGERKRCSIGVELISNPSVLFLDEPTTGLDAYTSHTLVETLARLADQNRTVIFSIHQPRASIFQQFDTLFLMSAGEIVYLGPGAQKSIEYFEGAGYRCPTYVNPADFLTDILTAENAARLSLDPKTSRDTKVGDLVERFRTTPLADPKNWPQGPTETITGILAQDKVNFVRQQQLLLKRNFVDTMRNPLKTVAKFMSAMMMGLILGSVYFDMSSFQTGVQDRLGGLFVLLILLTVPQGVQVAAVFPGEAAVFYKEHLSGMYRVSTYYFAKLLIEIPIQVLAVTIQCSIVYWMYGLQEDVGRFFFWILTVNLINQCSTSFALWVSCAVPSADVGNIVVPASQVVLMLFAGYLINNRNIPKYWIWLQYASFMKYGYQIMVTNEFEGLTFVCKPSEKLPTGGCIIPDGTAVQNNYDMYYSDRLIYMMALFIMIGGFNVLGYCTLRWKTYSRENSGS